MNQSIESMLKAVPENQRSSLLNRIKWAVQTGWKNLGFWTGEEIPDESDLFGLAPDSPYGKFVPFPEKENKME